MIPAGVRSIECETVVTIQTFLAKPTAVSQVLTLWIADNRIKLVQPDVYPAGLKNH